jgi:hypothetical protein
MVPFLENNLILEISGNWSEKSIGALSLHLGFLIALIIVIIK